MLTLRVATSDKGAGTDTPVASMRLYCAVVLSTDLQVCSTTWILVVPDFLTFHLHLHLGHRASPYCGATARQRMYPTQQTAGRDMIS